MSYTNDERNAAVSGLVKGTLSFTKDRLGPRDVNASFGEVQELVNTTLLYDPDAIFYLVYLASNRLQRLVRAEVATIDELLDAVDDLLKPDKPLDDVSGAADAEAALIALEGAMGRKGAVGAQEYSRYTSSVRRLTAELAKTTRYTFVPRGSSQAITDVVRPQGQARRDVRTYMDTLVGDHAAMLEGVDRLLTAFEDFQAQDLSASVAQKQVSRARTQMTNLKERLEALTPEDRIAEARTALLEALANRSVVGAVARAPSSGDRKVYQRLGAAAQYRLTAAGEGTAPSLTGIVSAPFKLSTLISEEAHNLGLVLNGNPSFTIDLLPSSSPSFKAGVQHAQVEGALPGPFVIRAEDDTPGPLFTRDTAGNYGLTGATSVLHIIVDGVPYEVPITIAASGTPVEVRDSINAVVGLKDVVTASVVAGGVSGTRVQIDYDYTTPGNMPASYAGRYMQVVHGASSAAAQLGAWRVINGTISGGNTPKVTGWDGNDALQVKANDEAVGSVGLPSGAYPDYEVPAATVASVIDAAGGAAFNSSVTSDGTVAITSEESGEGSIITILSAGLIASGDRVNLSTPSQAGMETLGFFVHQEDRQRDIDGHVVSNLLTINPDFKAEAVATVEHVEYFQAKDAQKKAVGVDPTHIQLAVPVDEDPVVGWPDFGELRLEVNNGDNRGIYEINGVSWLAGSLTIEVKNRKFREVDTSLLYSVAIFRDRLVITSKDESTTGSLEIVAPVGGESAQAVLGLPSGPLSSTVAQVLVEINDPKIGWKALDLQALGVRLEDDIVQEDTMTLATKVSSVADGRSGLLGVAPEVAAALSLSTTEGFFIRSAAAEDHEAFIAALTSWKTFTLPPYQTGVASIDRLLSPLLAVQATKGRVNQAYTAIDGLRGKLEGTGSLSEAVSSFSVTMIQDVEDILNGLRERGYDRALDVLVSGVPASFLTMTERQASFGRNAMAAMAEVSIEDVNETTRRGNQFEDVHQQLRSEVYADKNPINDFSDIEVELGDPPALELWRGLDD